MQTWLSEAEILFVSHLLKTDIRVFSNTANEWQVHSGKLLPPELQISQLKLYIDCEN